jgi:hypothetical protein
MRRLLGALSAVACGLGVAPAADTPAPPVETLIQQLGDPSFARRETASRELARLGHAALPALEKAVATSPDSEVCYRANAIAAALRKTVDASKHLTAKTVRLDYDRVPLGTAVSDLKAKTGVPLTLDQARVADPLRIITAKSDDLPAWEAIEAFCAAAGLKEVFRYDLTPGGLPTYSPYRSRRVYTEGGPPSTETAGQVPVVLADGKATLPGDRSTSIRVLALPPGFAGNKVIRGEGTVVLNLDVTPLGGLKWDDTTTIRIHKAEDETGRPITVSHRIKTQQAGGYYGEDVVFLGGGQMAWVGGWDGEIHPVNPNGRLNPRIVPVTLKTDDRSITALRVLEGAVVGEITLTNQTLATVPNLPKAAGRTVQAGDMTITVGEHKVLPDGRVQMKVRVESPNQWAMQRFGGGRRPGGRTGPTDGGLAVANGAVLRFADGDGKSLASPMMRGSNISDDGITQSYDYDLEFRKRDGYGVPATMTVVGNKAMAVEVPFRLKNVPLP